MANLIQKRLMRLPLGTPIEISYAVTQSLSGTLFDRDEECIELLGQGESLIVRYDFISALKERTLSASLPKPEPVIDLAGEEKSSPAAKPGGQMEGGSLERPLKPSSVQMPMEVSPEASTAPQALQVLQSGELSSAPGALIEEAKPEIEAAEKQAPEKEESEEKKTEKEKPEGNAPESRAFSSPQKKTSFYQTEIPASLYSPRMITTAYKALPKESKKILTSAFDSFEHGCKNKDSAKQQEASRRMAHELENWGKAEPQAYCLTGYALSVAKQRERAAEMFLRGHDSAGAALELYQEGLLKKAGALALLTLSQEGAEEKANLLFTIAELCILSQRDISLLVNFSKTRISKRGFNFGSFHNHLEIKWFRGLRGLIS